MMEMFDIHCACAYIKPFPYVTFVTVRYSQTTPMGENPRRNEVSKRQGELSNIKHLERGYSDII
jgi:hypothetical protein